MHQPLIPAGGGRPPHAPRSSATSASCWSTRRCGTTTTPRPFSGATGGWASSSPSSAGGQEPRVMLDYSGCLLHGLRQMGAGDVIEALAAPRQPTRRTAAASSGWAALGPRRRPVHAGPGLPPARARPGSTTSPPSSGWTRWGGCAASRPRRWRCPTTRTPPSSSSGPSGSAATAGCWSRSTPSSGRRTAGSAGRTCRTGWMPATLGASAASITAVIKTQGSDTKLVGQMQPYYEAKGLSRVDLGGQ